MRHALIGAMAAMALLFTASAVAVDLSRVLPSFELPAAPRLRAEAPNAQRPASGPQPETASVEPGAMVAAEAGVSTPDSTTSPDTTPSVPADAATQTAPTRRERGWREMLPGLLHQP